MATAPARGLEVSLRYILEHLLLPRQLGYQSFQPGVFLLQRLQPFGLLHLQASIFLPSPICTSALALDPPSSMRFSLFRWYKIPGRVTRTRCESRETRPLPPRPSEI